MGFNPFGTMGLSWHEAGLFGFSIDSPPLSAVVDLYITPSGTVDLFLKKRTQPNKYFFRR